MICMILPRQARDKHRENSNVERTFLSTGLFIPMGYFHTVASADKDDGSPQVRSQQNQTKRSRVCAAFSFCQDRLGTKIIN